jgi:hypothetical protein
MMKKIMMALAIAVGASSVLPVAASADSMYQDIMNNIVNNSLVKDDATRLANVRKALGDVYQSKYNAEYYLINSHGSTRIDDKVLGTITAVLSAITLLHPYIDPTKTFDSLYIDPTMKKFESLIVGGICGMVSSAIFATKHIQRYYDKKKLAELNEVIAKLEKVNAELIDKILETQHA